MNFSTHKRSPKELLSKYAAFAILIAMCLVITVLRPQQFLSVGNVVSVLSASSVYGCMALGATMIIITGGIDLSAGAILAFAGVIGAAFGQVSIAPSKVFPGIADMPFIVPVLAALFAGLLCGLVNGGLIARFNTPPFIITLGMTTVVRGATMLLTGGEPVSNLVGGYAAMGGLIGGVIPITVILFLGLVVLAHILLSRTRFGFDVYAIGSNRRAAEVSGVKVPHRLLTVYGFAGLMYAVAGLISSARAASIHPGAAAGYELTAVAACIIGGASPLGGVGSIINTLAGALIISVLRNGLTLLGIDSYWQQIAEGLVIIVAVALDVRRNRQGK